MADNQIPFAMINHESMPIATELLNFLTNAPAPTSAQDVIVHQNHVITALIGAVGRLEEQVSDLKKD